jgi:hypothetical protein
LIVEGNSATVNGNQVITSADAANYALKNAANTFTLAPQTINTGENLNKGLIVKGAASQTANLQEWQNSGGTVLSGINPAGQIYAGTTTSINGSTTTQITSRTFVSSTVATFGYSGTSLVQVGQRVTLSDFTLGEVNYNGTWPVTAVTSNSFTVLGSGFPNTFFGGGRFTVSSPASFVANTAVTTPIVVRGVASQTANLQEWQNSTGSPLLSINSAGQIQALQSSGLVVKASPTITATITDASGDGTAVFYTATNTFTPGQIVTITGVSPAAYNLSSVVIDRAMGSFFTVNNAATGTYVSGGTATVAQIANLQEWQNSSGTILANVSSSGEFTVPSLTVSGDFTVNGTTTNINSTNLVIEDKNIVLGDTTTPTDTTADGGGITLKGATDKTFNWVDSTDSWTSSEHVNLASGKSLYLNGTLLKDATETLTNKTLTSPKINEDVAVTATATEINILDGITSTTAELNILDGVTSTAAEINLLDGVTATTTELNYVDGVTSAIQTQIDAKAPLASPTFTGTVTIPANSAITGVPYLATANIFTNSPQEIANTSTSAIQLILRTNSGQTADNFQIKNITNTVNFRILDGSFGASGVASIGNATLPTTSQLYVQDNNASRIGVIVRGAAAQTANLQEWQNSAGTVLSWINYAGYLTLGSATTIGGVLGISTGVSTARGIVIRGASSQSVNLQEWQNNAGTVIASIGPAGSITTTSNITQSASGRTFIGGAADYDAFLNVNTPTATRQGLVVRANASQSANIQEWQNSAGTVLSGINAAGQIHAGTTTSINGSITGTILFATYVSSTVATFEYDGTSLVQVGQRVTIGDPNSNYYGTGFVGTWTVSAVTSNTFTVLGSGFSDYLVSPEDEGGTFTLSATGGFVANTAATTPIVVRGVASQTANLLEFQNSSGTVLASASSSGDFTIPSLTVSGDLTVNGTTTNINTTNLVVEDKNIVIGDTVTPTDITADGGGITLKGTTDKTFNWVDATDSWTSSEHINLASGKSLKLDGTAIDLVSSTLNILTPTFTTNAYTVVLTDKDKWLELSNGATAGTLNIPTDATANFAIGAQINILQTGAGQITIAAVTPGTTTVNGSPGLKLRGQWSVATIVKRAANTWVAVGDLSA